MQQRRSGWSDAWLVVDPLAETVQEIRSGDRDDRGQDENGEEAGRLDREGATGHGSTSNELAEEDDERRGSDEAEDGDGAPEAAEARADP